MFQLINAITKALTAFTDAGGIQLLLDTWKAKRDHAQAQQRMLEQQTIALALANGDTNSAESNIEQLLSEARDNSRRAENSEHRPGRGDHNNHPEPVGGDHQNLKAMQIEINELIE